METSPDLVVEIFYIQNNVFWRLNSEELREKIQEQYPGTDAADIDDAAKKAQELYELSQTSYSDAPAPSTAATKAVESIKKKLPGLSESAYSATAMIAMRNWIM
jgi:hypothetical protein